MPIRFEICENGHIIYAKVSDPLTIAEYEANIPKDIAHRNSVPFRVHSLINVADARHVPSGALSIRNSPSLHHPRAGKLAIVGTHMMFQLVAETIMRITKFPPPQFFDNEADAWAYLRKAIQSEASDVASASTSG